MTLRLLDKEYYDYDYVEAERRREPRAPRTADEEERLLRRFGFGRGKAVGERDMDLK